MNFTFWIALICLTESTEQSLQVLISSITAKSEKSSKKI